MFKTHFAVFEERRLKPILLRDWNKSEYQSVPEQEVMVLEKLSTSKIFQEKSNVASRIGIPG